MKLNQEVTKLLIDLINISTKLNLSNIILETGAARGIDDERTVVLLKQHDIELPFTSLAVNRVDLLAKRLGLSKGNVTIECIPHETMSDQIKSLKIKSGKVTVEYRCVNVSKIKVPKQVGDTFNTSITINEDISSYLTQGKTMMSASTVSFVYQNNKLNLEISDDNKDSYHVDLGEDIVDCEKDYFAYRYPIDKLHRILNQQEQTVIEIGDNRGFFKTNVNGFSIYVFPLVDE